jgi:putative ABC transport system permease protein
MFKNYFKIILRSMLKNKAHSFINIFGLAMGMGVFFLIMMYSLNELSYNKFHIQHKNIYQVEIGSKFYTMAPLGTMIKNNFPDIEKIVRIDNELGGGISPIIETSIDGKIKKIKVQNIVFADSALFDVFNFPVMHGNLATALNKPYSIVLTRNTTQLLFGTEDAVGKTIHYIGDRNSQPQMDMTITAVIEDIPNNSTISFNGVGSLSTFNSFGKQYGYDIDEDWRNSMYSTYVFLNQKNVSAFVNKLNKSWPEVEKRMEWSHEEISLVPLDEVYFHNNSKRQLIYLLQLIGVFILVIAIINFINLTIAKSTTRAREIGIRKVVGSNRITLIKQFLGESILISLMAAPIAVTTVELIKPFYFELIGKQIPFDLLSQPVFIFILIISIIIIGTISGIYPAIILSAFKPVSILKGEVTRGKKGKSLRHILIVLQFAISISLITCTILVSNQVDYLKTKDPGYNNKNIIHFNGSGQINQHYDAFKQKLLKNPDIINVSRSNTSLGQELPIQTSHELNGLKKPYNATTVDPDFIPTMEIQMIEGRPFSWEIASDFNGTAIVNETFAKEFELKQALGTEINFIQWKFRIIGVMKDFHYNSFHQKVEPCALINLNWNSQINIRINNQDISETIQYIKNTWNEFSPDTPFEFEFLDKTYDKLYKSDEQFQNIINSFSVVAIIIACLGLLGLISQNTESRTKEIGVRKILGATVNSIVFILTRDLLKWVVLANVVAWPVAYFFMNKWLEDFAYRIEINWWMFVLSGVIALVIAIATISFQAIKAATANPIEVLKYE